MAISFGALALYALTATPYAHAQLGGASRHYNRQTQRRQVDVDVNVAGAGNSCPYVEPGFDIARAAAQAERIATHSWEYGSVAECLLELYDPHLSVFAERPFPGGKIPSSPVSTTPGLLYSRPHILTNDTTLVGADGSAGDPAALGVMAIMMGQTESRYFEASRRQADHLLNTVPRYWNGAISHREDVAELWADFMYMAPPFLAYWAVATHDEELLEEVVSQCEKYREIMHANTTGPTEGLWLHIVGPQSADLVQWSTGNGWAAAGMTRILGTVKGWKQNSKRDALASRLNVLIKEILDGARGGDRLDGGLLRDKINDTTWWGEISGTALLTSTAYRVATLSPETFGSEYVSWADENRFALAAHTNSDAIAAPAINPLNWFDREKFMTGSPEGQSFMVLMYAAYRDCVCAGKCQDRQPPPGWTVPPSVPVSPITSAAPTSTASGSSSATSSAPTSGISSSASGVSSTASGSASGSVMPTASASSSGSVDPTGSASNSGSVELTTSTSGSISAEPTSSASDSGSVEPTVTATDSSSATSSAVEGPSTA